MKKSISVCILDKDAQYKKSFMSVIAAEHPGYSVTARSICGGDCSGETDVCIRFESCVDGSMGSCEKAFRPSCGRYAGVSEILREAKVFALGKITERCSETLPVFPDVSPLHPGTLLCLFSSAGGAGTSVAAIGIGRELSRYRGEQVLYLSLEDIEDPSLFPSGLDSMRMEETLYQYFRILKKGNGASALNRLFTFAAMRDEYGLYRLAPDLGLCSLSGLGPSDLYSFLAQIAGALNLNRIVLDFGTRLHFLASFADLADEDGPLFVHVQKQGTGKGYFSGGLFSPETVISHRADMTRKPVNEGEISLADDLGYEIRTLCDRILGQPV